MVDYVRIRQPNTPLNASLDDPVEEVTVYDLILDT
jgi:hypothetical protein